jgi:hypothetical protein
MLKTNISGQREYCVLHVKKATDTYKNVYMTSDINFVDYQVLIA